MLFFKYFTVFSLSLFLFFFFIFVYRDNILPSKDILWYVEDRRNVDLCEDGDVILNYIVAYIEAKIHVVQSRIYREFIVWRSYLYHTNVFYCYRGVATSFCRKVGQSAMVLQWVRNLITRPTTTMTPRRWVLLIKSASSLRAILSVGPQRYLSILTWIKMKENLYYWRLNIIIIIFFYIYKINNNISRNTVANLYFIYRVSPRKKIPLFDFGDDNNTRGTTE